MKEIFLIKNGEIALKGNNRGRFEDVLMRNIRRRLRSLGEVKIRKSQSTIVVEPPEGMDMEDAADIISKIFGIAAYSRAAVVKKDFAEIAEVAPVYLHDQLMEAKKFKVEARRSDKTFPMNSPQISCELGAVLLEKFPHLTVDVHNPDVTVTVEVRDYGAYIRGNQLPGAGGLPIGTSGRAMLLISGGIDSPVSGYMMAKRGISLNAIHFASPPYTSERARQKVLDLMSAMTPYCGAMGMYIAPFTEIQEMIRDHCPEDYFTLVMRRMMMRIAEKIALREECSALITGESVAQVASQTLQALASTEDVCTLPVLRPVIGMDKKEIIAIAERIGTFDISIEPFEDCCTVFTPKHPKTKPKLELVREVESVLPVDELVDRCVEQTERLIIRR